MSTKHLATVVAQCEEILELARVSLRERQRELTAAQDAYVGATEALRKAQEALRQEEARLPAREVMFRERDIARLCGVELNLGDPLSDSHWAQVCAKRSK